MTRSNNSPPLVISDPVLYLSKKKNRKRKEKKETIQLLTDEQFLIAKSKINDENQRSTTYIRKRRLQNEGIVRYKSFAHL